MRVLSIRKKATAVAAAALSSLATFGAMAADETGTDPLQYIDTAFASIMTTFNTAMGKAWPIITTVTIAFIAIRIFKKVGKQAV